LKSSIGVGQDVQFRATLLQFAHEGSQAAQTETFTKVETGQAVTQLVLER
jgi:hypothetical protein